jgi:hypothetical protein
LPKAKTQAKIEALLPWNIVLATHTSLRRQHDVKPKASPAYSALALQTATAAQTTLLFIYVGNLTHSVGDCKDRIMFKSV